MGRIPKQQGSNEQVEGVMNADYFLLYLVLFLAATFYVFIMYILKDADSDRLNRLKSLKKGEKNS
jgi:preprotein translocase subunit YajC